MCLKNKLRGVSRGLLSSPKGFSLFKGDEIVLQSFSDSQSCLEAREKSILSDCYPTSGPNASLVLLQMIPTYIFSQNKPSMWQNESKRGNNDFKPPKCLCVLTNPFI
jgi:hypothetical protein